MKFILILLATAATAFAGEAELIVVLKSDAALEQKSAACRQLASIGTKQAVPVLAPLLADEKLSHMARYALEPLPDSSADDAFRAVLGTLKGKLLIGVINSIAVRGDQKAIPQLLKLWQDSDASVADAAAAALGKLGSVEAAPKLTGDAALRCAEALKGKEAVAIYERLSHDKVPQIRAAAVRGLLCSGNVPVDKFLVEDDPVAFAATLKTIQHELPGIEITKSVAAQLDKLTPVSKPLLIAALGNRGDIAALPIVLAAAKTGDKPVRVAAFRALAQFGKPDAVPVLAAAVMDADLGVAAQEALASLPGREADAAVLALLADPVCCPVGILLASRRRMPSAMPALMKAASDTKLCGPALKAIGEMASEADVPALLNLLANGGGDAVEQALISVCGRSANAVEPVSARLSGATPAVKGALFRVLGSIGGPKALAAVRTGVTESDNDVKRVAVRTLATWKDIEAAKDLLGFAKSLPNATDKLLCLRGAITLAANPALPVSDRLAVCKQAEAVIERNDEKKLLLGTLGGIAHMDAMAMVLPYLSNAATKAEAGLAAVSIGDKLVKTQRKAVTEALQNVLQSTDDANLKQRVNAVLARKK